MQNTNSPKILQIPVVKANTADLTQQLSDENIRLHQIIDNMANTLSMQKELIQQLKDEIAILKGQKPKPRIPPSNLEGPGSKLNWPIR